MVAWALVLYAVALPAHSVVEIVVRAFYAMHDTKTPVLVSVAAMGLNVVLSLAFIAVFQAAGWPAHGGLALSNSLATAVEMAALLYLVRRRLGGVEGRELLGSVMRTALAAAVMAAAIAALARLLAGHSAWLIGGLGVVTGLAVYGGVSLLVGASEPRALWALIRPRRQTAKPRS